MTKKPLRIAFAGTPDFAARHLQALLDHEVSHHDFNIVTVYSQPDRPAGRGKKLKASPVKSLALSHDIPVHQPQKLNTPEQRAILQSLNIDVMIVVAYGLLLPQAILDIPVHGCLNVHASLLPRWRGAAPIERAILAGDSVTGISIMQMDAGLDTGDVLLSLSTPLATSDNSQILTARLIELGCTGLLTVIEKIEAGLLSPKKQDDTLSLYAHKLDKAEALINWHHCALEIQRQVNAFYPRSPAYSFLNHERLRVIQSSPANKATNAEPGTVIESSNQGILIACGDSTLLVTQVQLAGKKANTVADILNGQPELFSPGTLLQSQE